LACAALCAAACVSCSPAALIPAEGAASVRPRAPREPGRLPGAAAAGEEDADVDAASRTSPCVPTCGLTEHSPCSSISIVHRSCTLRACTCRRVSSPRASRACLASCRRTCASAASSWCLAARCAGSRVHHACAWRINARQTRSIIARMQASLLSDPTDHRVHHRPRRPRHHHQQHSTHLGRAGARASLAWPDAAFAAAPV
jgi:hypothetical protein